MVTLVLLNHQIGNDESRIVIMNIQWAKTNNSLFILTFDEDDNNHNNHIVTIFTGTMVKTGQYSNKIIHYNILRTIEDIYGLPYAGNVNFVKPITNCWK